MRKARNVFLAVLLVILVSWNVVAFAKINIPEPTSEFYVNDFAEIFSDEEKFQMLEKANELAEKYDGIQVVVTTIKTLDGYTVEEYANKMYNEYGIGKNDMGALLLVATEDRQIRFELGRAMEGYITDSKAAKMIDDYAIPYLKENKFSEGMISLQDAVITFITEKISAVETVIEDTKISEESKEETTNIEKSKEKGSFFPNIIIFILFGVICVVVTKSFTRNNSNQIQELMESNENLESANEKLSRELENANSQIIKLQGVSKKFSELRTSYDSLESKYRLLDKNYSDLQDRYSRACRIHVGIDNEVSEMIREEIIKNDMMEAEKVDSFIESVISKPVSKDILHELERAITLYSNLGMNRKKYIKSDIEKLNANYDKAYELNEEYKRMLREERDKKIAKEAECEILRIVNAIIVVNSTHLSSLKKAMSIYNNLGNGPLNYFDEAVIASVKEKLKIAEKKEREEEEERRRKQEEERRRRQREDEERRRRSIQSSMRSTSSFRSSGFGGRSGGGGASRGF